MAKNIDREINRILREEILLEESLDPPSSPTLSKRERGARKVLDQWLRKSGLDTKALEALSAEHQRESLRDAEKLKRLASKQGAALRKSAVAQARALRATLRPVAGRLPGGVQFAVLDQPRSIRTFPDPAVLTDSRISPGDNFAKIRVDRKKRSRDRLSFVFLFQNTSAQPVSVDAAATLTANGLLSVSVGNGIFGQIGTIGVSTRMSVHRFGFPFGAASGPHFIRELVAFNQWVIPSQDSSGPASKAVDHSVQNFLLAGNATMMVSVSMTVVCDFDSGRGIADFDFGLFGVAVPQVTLMISPPPID